MTFVSSAGNWTEDYWHENGQYHCRCVYCKLMFIGHKRRVVCKLCVKLPWDAAVKLLDQIAATVKTDQTSTEKKEDGNMVYVKQRHVSDCGVAALAMLCRTTYEEALIAIPFHRRGIWGGIDTRQVREAAEKLGYLADGTRLNTIRRSAKCEAREIMWHALPDNSLVKVQGNDGCGPNHYSGWHWVVWCRGMIHDPDAGVFYPSAYWRTPSSYLAFYKNNS